VRLTWKNAANLEKCAALGNVRRTLQNAAHLKKFATLAKMRHTRKTSPHLVCAPPGKVGHTWKHALYLEKCATLGKMAHTWKSAAQLEICATLGKDRVCYLKKGSKFEEEFTNWLNLVKRVTFGKCGLRLE